MARDPNVGLPFMAVEVDDVTGNMAAVKDQYGKRHDIRTDIRRGKGGKPKVGEVWLVDRTLGPWTFAACLNSDVPIITGSTDGIPALRSLLAALEGEGLIVNQTTDEPIRAVTPHVHDYDRWDGAANVSTSTGSDEEPV